MASKHLLIIGAGTGGTIVANKLRRRLPEDWDLTIVDPAPEHVYQPGLLFLPFNDQDPQRLLRERRRTIGSGATWIQAGVTALDPAAKSVVLDDGNRLDYDILVLATGSHPRPEETDGLTDEPAWGRSQNEFYTLTGATRTRQALRAFEGGRLLLNVVEMPIKCPVAPLEFLFLADAWFTRRGIRDRVELVYATPLDGAFTKPVAKSVLGDLLEEKGIRVEPDFSAGSVEDGELVSYDERRIPFDQLISIPTHMGAGFLVDDEHGDDLGFLATDPGSLRWREHEDVYVLGDATDLPTSKAGSVAHFQAEVVVENIHRQIAGRSLVEDFDGHANCFVETGHGKAMLIDFNFHTQPLPGRYPLPVVGPMRLLGESRMNHWGKLAFEWIYWHALLPGRPLPVPRLMSMSGKRVPAGATVQA